MNYSDLFRVKAGSKVELNKIDPDFVPGGLKRPSAEAELGKYNEKLRELQYRLYAEGKRSLLICLQGLDSAGKDGTIKHVLAAMNPQGTRVHGFKVPSREEAAHDFLWRIEQRTPARGEVAIFNRSHYEDVLVVRVHNLFPRAVWSKRYGQINAFEKRLAANGTRIIKFFLHISKDEQLRRFKQRLEDPARHWKISESDYTERRLWKDYQEAYETALGKTSTKNAPWYIIPADHKWFRNLAVSRILAETLESLKMKFPQPTVNLEDIRRRYHAAEKEEAAGMGSRKKRNKGKK